MARTGRHKKGVHMKYSAAILRKQNVRLAIAALFVAAQLPLFVVGAASANETNTAFTFTASYATDSHTSVENTANISIGNDTNQTAVSGDVSVDDVRSVGNIRTGDASNENCTSVQIVVAANALMTPRHSACAPTVPPVTPPVTPPTSDTGSVLGASTGGQGAGVATTAAQLANTGAEAIIGLFAGLSIIGTVSAAAYARRPIHN